MTERASAATSGITYAIRCEILGRESELIVIAAIVRALVAAIETGQEKSHSNRQCDHDERGVKTYIDIGGGISHAPIIHRRD